MLPTDRSRFAQCLLAVAELYGKPLSRAVADLWAAALSSYEINDIESAFRRYIENPDAGTFMPRPADIVRLMAGTSLDAAQIAWSKVDRAVREVGPYASVVFDDAIVQRVIADMGGWIALGAKTDKEWPFIGNEFRARYQGYKGRGETLNCPAVLVGIAEADCARAGFPLPQPTLIGDRAKALAVRAGGSLTSPLAFTRLAAAAIESVPAPERVTH